MKFPGSLGAVANALFFGFFAALLVAPHLLQGPLMERFEVAAARKTRNWAREPLKKLEPPENREVVLNGEYARYLDDHMKATLFSRYTTAIGNELLYRYFGTFKLPFVRGSDGWIFWDASLEYVVEMPTKQAFEESLEHLALTKELVTLCLADRDVTCVFIPVPKKASISSEHLPRGLEERRARGFDDPAWNSLLERLRRDRDNVLDLRPRMREMYLQGDLPYFKFDNHLSPHAMTETARLVAEEIRRSIPAFADRRGDPAELVIKQRTLTTDATYRMGFRDTSGLAGDFRFKTAITEFPTARVDSPGEALVALAGTSFGARFGDRQRLKGNLARALAWELDSTVQDHAIHAGGPIKGLLKIMEEAPSMPKLKVVVVEFPFRQSFSSQWRVLARTLVKTPWSRKVLLDYFEARPEERARFATFLGLRS